MLNGIEQLMSHVLVRDSLGVCHAKCLTQRSTRTCTLSNWFPRVQFSGTCCDLLFSMPLHAVIDNSLQTSVAVSTSVGC